jgi:dihydrofolate reductase
LLPIALQVQSKNLTGQPAVDWLDRRVTAPNQPETLKRWFEVVFCRVEVERLQERVMRTVTFGVANSVDNFIARADHAVDWLLFSKDVQAIMSAFWKTIDTVVMGRKTYDVALKAGMSSYPRVKNYVFSRTMSTSPDKKVRIIAADAAEFVGKLKQQKGKGICVMGGGQLAQSLFEADLIDEIGINIHPILLGSGVPLFLPMKRQVDLELRECKVLEHGCVFVTYRVKH